MDINNILDQFADDVTEINISKKTIEGSLDFKRFTKLIKLDCYSNKITSLDNLVFGITKGTETFSKEKGIPKSLIELNCSGNKITSLDNLVSGITKLFCIDNQITSLDNLPNSLIELKCDDTIKDYDKLMKKYNKLIKN